MVVGASIDQTVRDRFGLGGGAPKRGPRDPRSKPSALRLNGAEFLRLTGPIVYLWADGRSYELYAGMSARGLSRLFHRKHHVITREQVTARDLFYVWTFPTVGEAKRFERTLIRRLTPKHNKVDNPESDWEHGVAVPTAERKARRVIPYFRSERWHGPKRVRDSAEEPGA